MLPSLKSKYNARQVGKMSNCSSEFNPTMGCKIAICGSIAEIDIYFEYFFGDNASIRLGLSKKATTGGNQRGCGGKL
jgi:hypothetical protein